VPPPRATGRAGPPTAPGRGYVVIVRGPLGVGKTVAARAVARHLGARYLSIDRILEERDLWYNGALGEFLRANRVAARRARVPLDRGRPVVVDGNFYWKVQLEDLLARCGVAHAVFTLKAPLRVCIERDRGRIPSHGAPAARQVYAQVGRVRAGQAVDATVPLTAVVRSILARLPPSGFTAASRRATGGSRTGGSSSRSPGRSRRAPRRPGGRSPG
jgi:predicted kinase